jgi:uncharacterized secreted protein with C-terminal beta-propeller domain
MRVTLPPELQEKVDRSAQTADVSKQTKLVEIIDSYFRDAAPALAPTASHSELAPSLDLLKEERERYNQLYDQFQYLQGEYALIVTKLLPAAQRTMTPWWTRLVEWLKS